KKGGKFYFKYADGKEVRDTKLRARLEELKIRPDLRDVYVNEDPRGHIQAVGKDAGGKTQYLYHTVWDEIREKVKFSRLSTFGEALPEIREKAREDFATKGLTERRLLGAIVLLLDQTRIRPGNEDSAEE